MLLKIEETSTIDKINESLHDKFPYLKLVFFNEDSSDAIPSAKNRITELYKPLSVLFKKMRNAHINVNGNLQVRTLEQKIYLLTGIQVQIFRRSGKVWLETLTTDSKTLSELSRMATESLENISQDELTDYHEQK